MKTAMSLPDDLYASIERIAKEMGNSSKQLFAKALEEFIYHHTRGDITERPNQVYEKALVSENVAISTHGLESLRDLTKHDTWWYLVSRFWHSFR